MNSYVRWPATPNGITAYATLADLPAIASEGSFAVTLDTDTLYVYDGGWIAIASPSAILGLGALNGQAKDAKGASVASNTLYMQSADAAFPGVLLAADWSTFNAKQPAGNYITALTGDATAAGPGSVALTLATINSNVGSFGSSTAIPVFTVNAKGLITAASTSAVVAPAGTLTGTTLASNVVSSSLTSVGTLTGGATGAGFTVALGTSTISGTLPTANTAALTGDVTKTAGANSTVVAAIAGTTVSGTTGTGNVVFSASPTLTGTLAAAAITASGNLTLSALTLGSVPYIGTAGLISQDNSNFFYDSTNKGLRVGTNAVVLGQVEAGSFLSTASSAPANQWRTLAAKLNLAFDAANTQACSAGFFEGRRTITTTAPTDTGNVIGVQSRLLFDVPSGQTLTNSATSISAYLVSAVQRNSSTGTLAFNYAGFNISADSAAITGRKTGYLYVGLTGGTLGNAGIADNVAYSGDWFINSTSTNPSLFSGNVTTAAAVATSSYDTSTATSGTITCSANKPGLLITGAGGTTLTIKLPSSPIDGQQYWVASQGAFTTVTWQDSGGTAGNVIGGQAAIGGVNRGQNFVYGLAATKWFAIG